MVTTETKSSTTTQSLQARSQNTNATFFEKGGKDNALAKDGKDSHFFDNNFAVSKKQQPFFDRSFVQTKLTIGQPGDKYEQEADAMADQVVQRLAENNDFNDQPVLKNSTGIQRKPIFETEAEPNFQSKPLNGQSLDTTIIQPKCAECEEKQKLQKKEEPSEEEELQMKPIFESPSLPTDEEPILRKCDACTKAETGKASKNLQTKQEKYLFTSASNDLEFNLIDSKGRGSSLPKDTNSQMEEAFGADFSGVRVHTDTTAVQMSKDLGAQAFTHGSDIYFNDGKFKPSSTSGQHLLAHELVHTLQQNDRSNYKIQKEEHETYTEADLIPYTCSELKEILFQLIKGSFVALLNSSDELEDYFQVFMDNFSGSIQSLHGLALTEEEKLFLEDRAWALANLEATFNEQFINYPAAVIWLKDYLGMPPEVQDVGGRISYGTQFFIDTISAEIAYYLIIPIEENLISGEEREYCPPYSFRDLQTIFNAYIHNWSSNDGFIELEFIGSIEALIELRRNFANPDLTEDERIRIGTEISRLARYILLLNQELESLRTILAEGGGRQIAGSSSELETLLEYNAFRIESIHENATSEEDTLESLGSNIELLQHRNVENLSNSYYPIFNDRTDISPDAAFPAATDEATLNMMRELSDRIDYQAQELESLRENVIPSGPTYSFEEFIQIYDQWFAFFSPAARDSDPFYQDMNNLISEIYNIMGYAGVEGGLGRWLLMNQIQSSIISLGEANTTLEGTIGSQRLPRQRLTGSATEVNYQFGELFAGTGSDLSFGGERHSRSQTISRETRESTEGFNELRRMQGARASGSEIQDEAIRRGLMVPGRRGPIYLLPEERHQNLWSYLMTTMVMDRTGEYVPVNEQKVLPEQVSQYLLAQTQHYRTLQEPHIPRIDGPDTTAIGDWATRAQGIESGQASSVNTYLEGGTGENSSIEEATSLRRNMEAGRNAANLPNTGTAQQIAVQRLIQDLQIYLNAYFDHNEEVAPRVLAILRISVLEHRGDQALLQHFTPLALAKALGISIAIAGLVSALRYIPYVGFTLSLTIGKILRRYGIATDVGSVIAIAGFLTEASNANSFHDARRWAYLAKFTMSEIGQLLQSLAVSSVMDSFQIARTAVRNRQHNTVNEVMRDLEPLTREPELREILREDLEGMRQEIIRLGGQNESNPKLEMIQDILLRLDSSHPDKPITPDIFGPRAGEGDSILRADSTIFIGTQRHGLSVTFRNGQLIIRICSDCDAFTRSLDFAIEIALQRNLPQAAEALGNLKTDAENLQRRIDRREVSLEDAQPELNALKDRLQTLANRSREVDQVIDSALNRDGIRSYDEDLSAIRSPLDPSFSGRIISRESSRLVENGFGEIIQIDIAHIPANLRPGESFNLYGEQLKYLGDAHQRRLLEEGFSEQDLRSLESRARVMESHDMGVEQGRRLAQREGLSIVDMNPPDQYLGLFGKGIDEVGRRGNVFYILEYKGGSSQLGSTRYGTQMSDRWVGAKLAEFTIYYRAANGNHAIHPRVDEMLRAADRGSLRGRGYRTEWNDLRNAPMETQRLDEGPLAGGEARYNGDMVRAAFEARLSELRQRYGIDE